MKAVLEPPSSETKLVRCCSIWRALEDVGDVPVMLILEAAWLGERTFDGFRRRTGLLKALLSQRLKHMVSAGLMEKRPYCERPVRHQYRLTAKGRDLYHVALAMLRWETRWGPNDAKLRVRLDHTLCGASDIEPTPYSRSTGRPFTARDVSWRTGPGLGWIVPQPSRRRRQRGQDGLNRPDSNLLDTIVQVLGDRWASLVLRSIFTGFRRYDEIQKDSGAATNILAERLQWLIDMALIEKRLYSNAPPRHEYRLTEPGLDYYPVLVMLMTWGDRWHQSPEGAPLLLFDRATGAPLDPVMACPACGAPLAPEDVRFTVDDARMRATLA